MPFYLPFSVMFGEFWGIGLGLETAVEGEEVKLEIAGLKRAPVEARDVRWGFKHVIVEEPGKINYLNLLKVMK